ncbi:hypothetical protein OGAPHI_006611 [Ogataea philodendri]|uniref:Uncharacterized protein n=1 Tax=Ogataea philodendri TaxID=1378263 RepID=A0A9P8T0I5_9ASCO|nr:uncharacterized protein OGAPHI_006611 [Ogataea philodendri]KAH3661204.1 hypothetical protein OGAPHI_006611 [Ogataea philodendri]
MDVQQQLGVLNIHDYDDITDEFFSIASKIEYGDIAKSKHFKLLEGTHALEVMNPKLDTALLTPEQIDPAVPTLDHAAWVMARLLGCVCAWLDNNSLSVSVLSCHYVEQLILGNPVEGTIENKVLVPFVKAVVQFVNQVLSLGVAGVIYEEEDLNTQTMDLDFAVFESEDVSQTVNGAVQWLETQPKSESASLCIALLSVLDQSLKINSLVQINTELYQGTPKTADFSYIDKAVSLLDTLASPETAKLVDSLPKTACFSTNVQRTLNNRSPPKPLAYASFDQSVASFAKMFVDLRFMTKVFLVRDSIELLDYLNVFMCRRQFTADPDEILGNHIVVRTLMQLFLIRDDQSILGSKHWNISTLLIDIVNKISLQNSKIQQKLSDVDSKEIREGFEKLLTQLEPAFYNFLTSISQNPSRQRQFVNKELIIWDSIQVETENFETGLNSKLNDVFPDSELPAMPLASFVYYLKLSKMADLLFKSIELDLYKDPRELHLGYWQLGNQLEHLIQHIHRLLDLNRLRQTQINNYSKRIKKAKGDKKNKLREQYEIDKEFLPQFERMERYFEFQLVKYEIHKNLTESRVCLFRLLQRFGLLGLPKLCKVSEEILYNLQFKSYQTIGIPQLLPYSEYQHIMRQNVWIHGSLQGSGANYERVLMKQRADRVNLDLRRFEAMVAKLQYPKFMAEAFLDEVKLLKKANIAVQLAFSQVLKAATESSKPEFKVSFEKIGYHLYYPNIKVTTK